MTTASLAGFSTVYGVPEELLLFCCLFVLQKVVESS